MPFILIEDCVDNALEGLNTQHPEFSFPSVLSVGNKENHQPKGNAFFPGREVWAPV
jgi:hypothetical protein